MMFKLRTISMSVCVFTLMGLMACGGSQPQSQANSTTPATETPATEEKKIKKAPKLSPDATAHAQRAWKFIQEADVLLTNTPSTEQLEQQIRQPIRLLTEEWLTQVKMNDAVTEGKYALCRKTLMSMDMLAREMLQQGKNIEKKRQDYQRDKALCQDAIEHPELGNTDPKKVVPPKIS